MWKEIPQKPEVHNKVLKNQILEISTKEKKLW